MKTMKWNNANRFVLVFLLLIGWLYPTDRFCMAASVPTLGSALRDLIRQPAQITAESDPVSSMTVSADGKNVLYTVDRDGFNDLWLISADPGSLAFPKRMTDDPSLKSSPVFSPNGNLVAYRGNAYDVKGDIYLLDIRSEQLRPRRLTGRATEDDGPCFTANGKQLFFHRISPQQPMGEIVVLPLNEPREELRPLDTGGDASFPAVSPDGKKICFVSHRQDRGGDIFQIDMETGIVTQVTDGPALDFSPSWSTDGHVIFFTRISADTNKDGRIDSRDRAVIHSTDGKSPPCPITPLNESAFQVRAARNDIFYLSDRRGISNCWRLPETGIILPAADAAEQLSRAERVSATTPYNPYLALLSYHALVNRFGEDKGRCAPALLHIGDIYRSLEYPDQALMAYERIRTAYAAIQPAASLSEIAAVMTRSEQRIAATPDPDQRRRIAETALQELEHIGDQRNTFVQGRIHITAARILLAVPTGADSLIVGLHRLDQVILDPGSTRAEIAEAIVLKADIHRRAGSMDSIRPLYLSVARDYPDQTTWAATAVENILDLVVTDLADASLPAKIRSLRRIAEDNYISTPMLSLGALNRMGDLYFSVDKWGRAKKMYEEAIRKFPNTGEQTAAARLSLAEILYREERFRQALDLYGQTIDLNPEEEHIRSLARQGYIRKSIASGEFLFRLGEIWTAQKTFKELMDYDDRIVEAHRGYIQCAAALNRIPERLETYQERLRLKADDVTAIYGTALCLTYLDNHTSLKQAKDLLEQAVRLNGQIEYFHQTLGYVLETLETVYGEKGLLKASLASYYKAFFLNDQTLNPDNRSHLLLNIGNLHFLLGQYSHAFAKYRLRRERRTPFEYTETEIVFYQRFGKSAFQIGNNREALDAYHHALELTDAAIDPAKAIHSMQAAHRWITDTLLIPAMSNQEIKESAKPVLQRQTDIQLRLGRIAQVIVSPTETGWQEYRENIRRLITAQEQLMPELAQLSMRIGGPDVSAETTEQILRFRLKRVTKDLANPEKMSQLRAELTDRLGIVYQELGEWEKAADQFEQAFQWNRRLGLSPNLARNRRSAAYNEYMLAQQKWGSERRKTLMKAADHFQEALQLVDQFGVVQPNAPQETSLINIDMEVAFDEKRASRAGHGFSADQESRLAEAFLSRIQLELGHMKPALENLQRQLSIYPPGKPVADKDVFGVSLLYHRAGLLSAAEKKYDNAFDYFEYSEKLSENMNNPMSSARNVANMAWTLIQQSGKDGFDENRINRLMASDETATAVVSDELPATDVTFPAGYHNTMGVYYVALAGITPPSPEGAVQKIRLLQKTVSHFSAGISLLEKPAYRTNRHILNLLAVLHLNMAASAAELDASEPAKEHVSTALSIAEHALLPDIEWRALAGLGRPQDALAVLDKMTLLRAYCEPFEIIDALSKLVTPMVDRGKTEEAFNLAEEIAEQERFHRTAFLLGNFEQQEKILFNDIRTRLLRIRKLRRDISGARKLEAASLSEALVQEQDLLQDQIGKDGEKLPDALRRLTDPGTREQAMLLIGVAAQAELIADEQVRETDTEKARQLLLKYRESLETYQTLRREMVEQRPEERISDVITLFGPEPMEAVDVMSQIPINGTWIRCFGAQPGGGIETETGPSDILAFELTGDSLTTRRYPSLADARKDAAKKKATFVFENPGVLPENLACALNATHFVRSRTNRKPFKRSLLALPPPLTMPADFELVRLPVDPDENAPSFTGGPVYAHTLLISHPVDRAILVPTRSGERAARQLSMWTENGTATPVHNLLKSSAYLALALLPGASLEDAYVFGQLLSIFGCPALLIPKQSGDHHVFLDEFLRVYPTASPLEAKIMADAALEKWHEKNNEWILIGDKGMTRTEAEAYSEKYLTTAIQKGRQAFEADRATEALAFFEDAVHIAAENETFKSYRTALYRYARESAYRAKDNDKALMFSQKLVDLIRLEKPDSKEHAEALLRLGLITAAREENAKAVPILEEAVEILSNLELGPEQAAALSDLGVVLENATDYDRALNAFQTAAELSRKVDKQHLLALQYNHIGRLNDLRLSRYAAAIEFYQKAMEIHRNMTAERDQASIVQASLNIGRCYRLMGNFAAAEHHFAEALSDSTTIPDRVDLKAKILLEQANSAWFQSRYEDAFRLQRKAHDLARENHLTQIEIMTSNTAGLIWWTLGDHQRSLDILEQTLSVARKQYQREDEIASTLNNIGLIHRDRQHFTDALAAFDEALAIDTRLKSRWAMAYDYRNKALTLLQMGRTEESLPLFESAVQESHAIGNRINEAKALLGLGQARAAAGNASEAEKSLNQALEMARSMSMGETEWRCLYELSVMALKTDPAAAETYLQMAVRVIEGMRSEIHIEQLKEAFIDNKMSVYETLVGLLADQGKIEAAFEIAERSRARGFIDLLGNQRLSLNRAVDQALYDRHQQIRQRIEETRMLLDQARQPEEKNAYQRQLTALDLEFRNVLIDIQANNPQLANFVSVVPLAAAAFTERIEPHSAFLSYYILPHEILCWVVRSKTANQPFQLIRTPIDRKSFGQSILEYRRLIQNLEPLEDQSKKLYSQLLEKARPYLKGIQRLGIIPHGPLHYLSFATLWDGNKFLVDDFALFYLPSAGVWQYTTGRRQPRKNLKVLAIGNPDLGDPALALPFAEHEVGTIRWNFPDITVLTEERATEKWVKANISIFGVIHLASHGEFDAVNPLFSAIRLTKSGDGDGKLDAAEVLGLEIKADMVVLSACQTGLGKVTGGDDVIGLNRAFFYAGTHTVIASLWRVSDVSTAVLIKSFYRAFVSGDKADSLRLAILHVKNRYQHPGYWGAFVLVGDYR